MTRTSVGLTLLCGFAGLGCQGVLLCTAEDFPSLRIGARSAANGVKLTGLSGTVTSAGGVLPIGCIVVLDADQCTVFARGTSANIHLERAGYAAWDTVGVQLSYVGHSGCEKAVLKTIEAEMVPVE